MGKDVVDDDVVGVDVPDGGNARVLSGRVHSGGVGGAKPVVLVAAARTGATSEFTAPSGLAKRGTSTVKTAPSQLASVDAQENSTV